MSRVWIDDNDRPLTRREKWWIALIPLAFLAGCFGEVLIELRLR